MVAAAVVVVVVVVVVVNGVGGGDVGLLFFCGQDREKCPSCLQNQHCGFLPSTITVITWLSFILNRMRYSLKFLPV